MERDELDAVFFDLILKCICLVIIFNDSLRNFRIPIENGLDRPA